MLYFNQMAGFGELKFLCDEQLGKLARWMRILGLDVYFKNKFPDDELIEFAKKQSRIVLTRDHNLIEKLFHAQIPYILIEENYPADQLRFVVERFKEQIKIRVFSRCVDCNVLLEEIAKEKVRGLVPPFVFQTQNHFRRCPSCGKIFWSATHKKQVDIQLRDVLGELYDQLREDVWETTQIQEK